MRNRGCVVLMVLALAGCGGSSAGSTEAPSTPRGVSVNGSLFLRTSSLGGGTLEELMAGTPCVGSGGYSDIGAGTQVTVTDETSKVVGVGQLGPGKFKEDDPVGCVFTFVVKGVEPGHPFYGVEVAHRGAVRYAGDQIQTVSVQLGS